MSSSMHADTQTVEAVNSVIRIISERCRRSSLELLSARVLLKYGLTYCHLPTAAKGAKNAKTKIASGEMFLADIEPYKFAFKQESSADRWSVVGPVPPGEPGGALVFKRSQQVDATNRWAASYATVLRRTLYPRKKRAGGQKSNGAIEPPQDVRALAIKDRPKDTLACQDGATSGAGCRSCFKLMHCVVCNREGKPCGGRWFMECNKFSYTMAFIELFETEEDASVQPAQPTSALHLCADDGLLDAHSVFKGFYDQCQAGLTLHVFQTDVDPSCVCLGLDFQPDNLDTADSACSMGVHIPGRHIVFGRLPKPVYVADESCGLSVTGYHRLLTATAELHPLCNKLPEQRPPKAKQNMDAHTASDSDADDDAAAQAQRALAESSGLDLREPDQDVDDSDRSDVEAVSHRTVSKIKTSIKQGKCPPSEKITHVADMISAWQQYNGYSRDELEEEALLLIIRNLISPEPEKDTATGAGSNIAPVTRSNVASRSNAPLLQAGGSDCGDQHPQEGHHDLLADSDLPEASYFAEQDVFGGNIALGAPAWRADNPNQLDSVFAVWAEQIAFSLQSIDILNQTRKVGENISLVLMRGDGPASSDAAADSLEASEILWVHWLKHKRYAARQVNLDARGRVVFSIAHAFPELDCSPDRCAVLVADAGVPMLKVRAPERPLVPDTVRKAHDMIALMMRTLVNKD